MSKYCAFHDLEHYLPLRQETKVFQRRKVTVNKPVFPGYVFVQMPATKRELALKSNYVVRMIPVKDQDTFLWEVEQVQKALTVDPTLGATQAFSCGRLVRVTGGPFQGLEGKVVTVKGETRVMLNVDMIGQAVSLEVDMDLLDPIQ